LNTEVVAAEGRVTHSGATADARATKYSWYYIGRWSYQWPLWFTLYFTFYVLAAVFRAISSHKVSVLQVS